MVLIFPDNEVYLLHVIFTHYSQYYASATTTTETRVQLSITEITRKQSLLTALVGPCPFAVWWGPASCGCRRQSLQPRRRQLPRERPQGTVLI